MARGRGRAGRHNATSRRTDGASLAFVADDAAIVGMVDDLPDTPDEAMEFTMDPEGAPVAPAALPVRIDGLTHRQIFYRAQQVISEIDARRAAKMAESEALDSNDLWNAQVNAAGILDRDTQRLLVAAARLSDDVVANPRDVQVLRERARETLVATNTRILYKNAMGLAKVAQNESYDSRLQALLALGQEAILETVDRYEFDRPEQSNFLTYASWWVRQAMQRYTYNNSNAAKVPEHRQVLAMRVRRTMEQLRAMGEGKDPSFEQVVDQLNAGGGKPVERESVKDAMELLRTNRPESLNRLVRGSDGSGASEIGHLIEDTRDFDPLAEIAQEQLAATVDEALEDLPDRQRKIIIDRYGLGDNDAMEATEVQKKHGETKGGYDGAMDRGKRALALKLALSHRPEYLAAAMERMDRTTAQCLRLAHGLDRDGRTTRPVQSVEAIATWFGCSTAEAEKMVARSRKEAVDLMTKAPASRASKGQSSAAGRKG